MRAALIAVGFTSALWLSALGVQTIRLHDAQAELAAERRERAEDAAAAAQAHAEAVSAARTEELRRMAKMQEIADETRQSLATARADAAAARAAGDRLRIAARAAGDRASCGAAGDTAAATGGEAATAPGVVLADVLGWADDAAGELAAALDAARTAGLACERAYGSLSGG